MWGLLKLMTVASNLSLSIKMSQPLTKSYTYKAGFPDFLTSWFPLGELETGEGQLRDPTQATQALQADKSTWLEGARNLASSLQSQARPPPHSHRRPPPILVLTSS